MRKSITCSFWRSGLVMASFLLLAGCVSHESLLNYQKAGNLDFVEAEAIKNRKDHIIQSDDILDVKVYSLNMEAAAPFNLRNPLNTNQQYTNPEALLLSGYLVNQAGNIDFPILGQIYLKGRTIEEAKGVLHYQLNQYLKDAVVDIRLVNFRVTVQGEVKSPGTFTAYNARLSLPEAISMAGDFTDYADRTSVMIVRESEDTRTFTEVDLTSIDIFRSSYFYLNQNDLIYVKPSTHKPSTVRDNSLKILPYVSAGTSIVALLIAILK